MISLIAYLFTYIALISAEITPLNYDFTLKSIEPFIPGKNIEEIKKQNPQFDTLSENGEKKTLRFKLKRATYSLEVYTQVKKETVTDLFVRLPQFFLHDIFLRDLQKKWKKQDKFFRHDHSALYTWLNRDSMNILYQGSCSLTCFPMFIEIVSTEKTVIPLYVQFNEALPLW